MYSKKYEAMEWLDTEEHELLGLEVIMYLKRELENVESSMKEYKEGVGSNDDRLRRALVEVINYVADSTDNEEARVGNE